MASSRKGRVVVLAATAATIAAVGCGATAGASAVAGPAHHRVATTLTHKHAGVANITHARTVAASQSNNWSGYNQGALAVHKKFSAITAKWVVPTATQHTAGEAEDSASWIGIGGGCVNAGCTVTDSTLIQTGTEQDVATNGSATYDAWFELIPKPETEVKTVAVHPGDTISASITESGHEVWKISLQDLTDGQGFNVTRPYTSTQDSAEWIEETPLEIGVKAGLAALPNLGTVNFNNATTNGKPAGLQPSQEIQLTDKQGDVLIDPSAPNPAGNSFNDCVWETTCAAPSS
jgi:hypothetical protein